MKTTEHSVIADYARNRDATAFRVNVRSVSELFAITTTMLDNRLLQIVIREIKALLHKDITSLLQSVKLSSVEARWGRGCTVDQPRNRLIFLVHPTSPTDVYLHLWELPSRSQLAAISLFFLEARSCTPADHAGKLDRCEPIWNISVLPWVDIRCVAIVFFLSHCGSRW